MILWSYKNFSSGRLKAWRRHPSRSRMSKKRFWGKPGFQAGSRSSCCNMSKRLYCTATAPLCTTSYTAVVVYFCIMLLNISILYRITFSPLWVSLFHKLKILPTSLSENNNRRMWALVNISLVIVLVILAITIFQQFQRAIYFSHIHKR